MGREWGVCGFEEHVRKVENFYERRRDLMNSACEKHLSGLCEWSKPKAGMFFWIRVKDVDDTWSMIMTRGLEKNIMLVPGKVFMPEKEGKSSYLRASYSIGKRSSTGSKLIN